MKLTRPEIFYLFAIAYLLVGVLAVIDPAMLAVNPNLSIAPLTIFVWLFGFACLFLGFRFSDRVFKLRGLPVFIAFLMGVVVLNITLQLGWLLSIALNALALLACWIILNLKHLVTKGIFRPVLLRIWPRLTKRVYWEYMFLVALAAAVLNFAVQGIPALSPGLHYDLLGAVTLPFIFSFYLMLYTSARLWGEKRGLSRAFFLILFIVSVLSSFRSFIGIAILAWLFLEARERKMNLKVAVAVIVALIAAVGLFAVLGHSAASNTTGTWGLNPVQVLEYRMGFTNHVFDDVVAKAFPWGYGFGQSLEKPFGVYPCHALYGCENRLTTSLMGEVMLDFGLIGVLIMMLFTGAVLQRLWKRDYALYALMIAHFIVAIEVGAGYYFLLLLVYLGYLGGNLKARKAK